MKIDLNTNKFLNYKIKNNKESYIITFLSSLFIFLLIFLIYEIVPFGNNSLCTNDGVAQYIPFI